MTAEAAEGGESSIQLPSYEDVQKDLKRVRQQEGASVRRIANYGRNLQELRISQEEFRRSGSQPGTLPMATIAALECAVRSFGEDSVHFTILDGTLNFRGVHANLTDRQQEVMNAIPVYSKTTYELYEKNSYEVFAYRIQQEAKSFCGQTASPAEAIAKLPFEQRAALIQVLLDARLADRSIDKFALAEEVLQALPRLASVPPLDGMDALQKIDRAVVFLVRSDDYRDAKQANTAVSEAAFQIIDEIARRYGERYIVISSIAVMAAQFDRALAARLRNGEREGVATSRFLDFGELSQLSQRDLKRLAKGGRFAKRGEPTPRFDKARFVGVGLLASLLVNFEQANGWKELFGQLRYSKPQPPSPKPTETKKPDRPRKTGNGRKSDS